MARKRSRKPPGRPSKLTPEMQRTIADALRAGNYREVVASYAGIAISTLYEWLERGAADLEKRGKLEEDEDATDEQIAEANTIYAQLSEAVTRAEAEAELRAVTHLHKAGGDDWRAAAEYLQRRHSARWSKTDRLEVEGDHTVHGSIPIEIVPTDEQRAEVARLMAEAHGDN